MKHTKSFCSSGINSSRLKFMYGYICSRCAYLNISTSVSIYLNNDCLNGLIDIMLHIIVLAIIYAKDLYTKLSGLDVLYLSIMDTVNQHNQSQLAAQTINYIPHRSRFYTSYESYQCQDLKPPNLVG